MKLDEAVSAFPPASPFRKVLPKLASPDEDKRITAAEKIEKLCEGKVDKRLGLALLRAAQAEFPAPDDESIDARHDMLFALVQHPQTAYVAIARDAYPALPARSRCAVLALFGAVGTRDAAKAFMHCIREHGWPRCYSRVFTEATKLHPHADLLFPELVERAGDNLARVTDLLVDGLASGQIDAKRIDLDRLAPLVTKALTAALAKAAKYQKAKGTTWRFAEKYFDVRRAAGAWLDVAGHLRARTLDAPLKKGLALRDPRLALFAATSILRRGGKVPNAKLEELAACHETRSMLYTKLEELGALARFPERWRTWDAFAMGEMVEWLLYPSELGKEPDAIEQMHVISANKRYLHVFRFRDGQKSMAGVAGPYTRSGKPRPQHGNMTFSRFDTWGKTSAEDHAEAIVKTLAAWAKS